MGVDSGAETLPWLRALPPRAGTGALCGAGAAAGTAQADPAFLGARAADAPRCRRPRRPRDGRAPTLRALPPARRYRIREENGVRTLACVEAPTVSVRVERGLCVRASEARHAAPGTIFVDGAAQGRALRRPRSAGVFNLDHHEGCVRAFTLAACEQAMVLLLRGLDLRRREWTVLANDADLDAVLAIWVLLNHHRLAGPDASARAEIMPLLRLEGVIDAHGLAMQEFCGLPPELHAETRRRMERLRDSERSLRATGRWQKLDVLEYVQERLEQIDELIYPSDAFVDLIEVEELGRAMLHGEAVAVACRAPVGIYEVEGQLARFYGPRLGVVVLRQREGVYTLRQTDPALAASLNELYAHLNRIDPAARADAADRRWGGSEEIGGSPRAGGTRLSADAILAACRHVYQPWTRWRRIAHGALATAATAAGALVALGAWQVGLWNDAAYAAPAFAGVLALVALCAWTLGRAGRARALRRPAARRRRLAGGAALRGGRRAGRRRLRAGDGGGHAVDRAPAHRGADRRRCRAAVPRLPARTPGGVQPGARAGPRRRGGGLAARGPVCRARPRPGSARCAGPGTDPGGSPPGAGRQRLPALRAGHRHRARDLGLVDSSARTARARRRGARRPLSSGSGESATAGRIPCFRLRWRFPAVRRSAKP